MSTRRSWTDDEDTQLIFLWHHQKRSVTEIAASLDKSSSAVKKRINLYASTGIIEPVPVVTNAERIDWVRVLDTAREVVTSYDTSVTLRQLFYRLVARQLIPNTQYHYRRLSAVTAESRRGGTFPDLIDQSREIYGVGGYESPAEALRRAARFYNRNWTEGQPVSIFLGVEKRGMVSQLSSWFGGRATIFATGGYASQTQADDIKSYVARQDRPAILFYAGDHDPTGEDIERDLIKRTDCWKAVRRIALTPQQVIDHSLPEYAPTKEELKKLNDDPRAKAFEQRHGSLVQYEVDALPPDVLRDLYQSAFDEFWDEAIHQRVLVREASERQQLIDLADEWEQR
jgi:hypothetical protein